MQRGRQGRDTHSGKGHWARGTGALGAGAGGNGALGQWVAKELENEKWGNCGAIGH